MAKAKTVASKKDTSSYTGEDIRKLPFPENVQTRPEMYIGTTNANGMLTCGREIVNNSVDEFLAGFATVIEVTRLGDFHFIVKDNGRGVPFDKHESGQNTMEVIFGALHAGRNFSKKTVYSTGLFGVGSSCVNALSKVFDVTSRRGNKSGRVIFNHGIISKVELNKAPPEKGVFKDSSTTVEFELDPQFFDEGSVISDDDFISLLRHTAYLTFGLEITYTNQKKKKTVFKFGEDGMAKLLDEKLGDDELFSPLVLSKDVIQDTAIQVSFTYTNSFSTDETIYSFCNTIGTSEHGTHVTGFKRSISQKFTAFLRDNKLCKENIDNKDIYAGLNAAVSVMVFEPKYSSQTKQKLDNNEVNGHVFKYMTAMLDDWLLTNPKEMKLIAAKIDSAAKARIAQKRALEAARKDSNDGVIQSLSIPDKFTDCNSKNPEERELFLVEGDSAGGTAKNARDKDTQAIFCLRGKPLNTHGKKAHEARANKEINAIASILKCGLGDSFDMEKLQFHKIVQLADADVDGKHIELLLSTFFGTHLKPLVDAGFVYINVTPLYRATSPGKKPVYLRDEAELDQFYTDEILAQYEFHNENGNKLKNSLALVSAMRLYKDTIEKYSHELQIEPNMLERAILNNFNRDLEYSDKVKGIDVSVTESDDVVLKGFYNDPIFGEKFLFVNHNIDDFEDMLMELMDIRDILDRVHTITPQKGNEIVLSSSSVYNIASDILTSVNRKFNVTRFKG